MPFVEPFGDSFEVPFIRDESAGRSIVERRILGRSLGRLAEWVKNGRLDVPPHEFFHIYWLMRFGLDAMSPQERTLITEGKPYKVSAEFKNIIKMFKNDAYEWIKTEPGYSVSAMGESKVVEEYLARHVGEYYAGRMKGSMARRIGNWLKLFWARLKKMFKPTQLTSNDIFNIIAEEFYTGKKVNKSIQKVFMKSLVLLLRWNRCQI